jgi:toxin HigB-1
VSLVTTILSVIETFRHKGLKRLYHADDPSGIGADMLPKVRRILSVLDAAGSVDAVRLPGFDLHPLKGDRKGYWGVSVNKNYRIVFRFEGSNVFDVELVDYH